jgi:LPXTG-site transpeptidase (sortase) family protein
MIMHDLGPRGKAGSGPIAQILIWGGILLLIVGGSLIYPYVRSRLATLPTPMPKRQAFAVSAGTKPSSPSPPTSIPTDTPPPTLTHTPIPAPTRTLPPTQTPAPALPTRIVIPSIDVDAPVLPVSWQTTEVNGQEQAAWEVLDMYAAGWHETSAPLGVPGNTVFNGHNTTHGEVFRDLYTLEAGDEIVVYSDDTPYAYVVSEVLILPEANQPLEVRIENARYALPTEDERLTLITCHPYGSLRYRLIVIAYPDDE